MNPWREVLRALQAELDRLSQEIDGHSVLPNGVTAVLPAARFERWAPILEAVTAELGQALVAWVDGSRRAWYAGAGPFLTVELDAERTQSEVTCHFLESGPDENPATEEEQPALEPASGTAPATAPPDARPAEASWEPPVRSEDSGSPLDRFELDAQPYLSGAAEPPPLEEPEGRRSRQGGETVGEDEEIHLSQIELD